MLPDTLLIDKYEFNEVPDEFYPVYQFAPTGEDKPTLENADRIIAITGIESEGVTRQYRKIRNQTYQVTFSTKAPASEQLANFIESLYRSQRKVWWGFDNSMCRQDAVLHPFDFSTKRFTAPFWPMYPYDYVNGTVPTFPVYALRRNDAAVSVLDGITPTYLINEGAVELPIDIAEVVSIACLWRGYGKVTSFERQPAINIRGYTSISFVIQITPPPAGTYPPASKPVTKDFTITDGLKQLVNIRMADITINVQDGAFRLDLPIMRVSTRDISTVNEDVIDGNRNAALNPIILGLDFAQLNTKYMGGPVEFMAADFEAAHINFGMLLTTDIFPNYQGVGLGPAVMTVLMLNWGVDLSNDNAMHLIPSSELVNITMRLNGLIRVFGPGGVEVIDVTDPIGTDGVSPTGETV